MTSDRGIAPAIAALTNGDPPRVWSLLVTIFGDLGSGGQGAFSSMLLRDITAPIGIKPEALRVALHRLRKEGWITSTRDGRASLHHVTPWGLSEIATAAPRIYAAEPPTSPAYLIITEPGAPDPPGLPLRPGVALGTQPAPDALCTALRGDVPPWVQARCCPPDLQRLAAATHARLRAVAALYPPGTDLPPVQRAILRVLVVHGWRRIALRLPDLPANCLPPDFAGPACQSLAMALLDRLHRPALAELAASDAAA